MKRNRRRHHELSDNRQQGDTSMSEPITSSRIGRRQLFRYAGGAAAAAAAAGSTMKWLQPFSATPVGADPHTAKAVADMFLGGTDGWISLPASPTIPPFHPDSLAPPGLSTYIFGFRNITDLVPGGLHFGQKNHAQHSAPLFWVKQFDPTNLDTEFVVDLTNLGLAQRPDLFDAHTLHWHGFRNVIPFFDGEPTGSVSVPAGTVFRYVYRPRDPGTYMYHCHVEDVEHVHMGMTGLVFVDPIQNGQSITYNGKTFTKFLYNDGDGSTGYDRVYSMFMSEVWAEAHWADAHIQLPEWSDYNADFSLLNGRVYPDTIQPNSPFPPGFNPNTWTKPYMPVATDAAGNLQANPGLEHLRYQPVSSLVNCNAGDTVALRFASLAFKESAMTLAGIPMRVVGRDATPMRGRGADGSRTGVDTSYETNTLVIGAGESMDVLFTAPPYVGPGPYDTYPLFNRASQRNNNLGSGELGGQATEIHVYPAGIAAQKVPNT